MIGAIGFVRSALVSVGQVERIGPGLGVVHQPLEPQQSLTVFADIDIEKIGPRLASIDLCPGCWVQRDQVYAIPAAGDRRAGGIGELKMVVALVEQPGGSIGMVGHRPPLAIGRQGEHPGLLARIVHDIGGRGYDTRVGGHLARIQIERKCTPVARPARALGTVVGGLLHALRGLLVLDAVEVDQFEALAVRARVDVGQGQHGPRIQRPVGRHLGDIEDRAGIDIPDHDRAVFRQRNQVFPGVDPADRHHRRLMRDLKDDFRFDPAGGLVERLDRRIRSCSVAARSEQHETRQSPQQRADSHRDNAPPEPSPAIARQDGLVGGGVKPSISGSNRQPDRPGGAPRA